VDLPVFALHAVCFPGQPVDLRVFEDRYLQMMEDVLPEGPFVVAAIRRGQEVGGPAEPCRVGVVVAVQDYAFDADEGTYALRTMARDRVALVRPLNTEPYPRWQAEPYPDEGGAGTDDVEAAAEALTRYLAATGEDAAPVLPHDPVAASFALAAAAPGLLPDRQELLEVPGAGERLTRLRTLFRREAALVRALGAGVGGADLDVSPN
jgi:uncharacterized protein